MYFIFLYVLNFFPLLTASSIITSPIDYFNRGVVFYQIDKQYKSSINTFRTDTLLSGSFNNIDQTILPVTLQPEEEAYQAYLHFIPISPSLNISAYYVNSHLWTREIGLAFGYKVTNESFSYVHTLYNKKIISHRMFIMHNLRKELKGNLYIGGVPNNEHIKMIYKGKIKVNVTLPTWGFMLRDVKFKNIVYSLNIPTIISSNLLNMFISDDFYEFMLNKVLDDGEYAEVRNSFLTTTYQKQVIAKEGMNKSKEISFVFDNIEMKIILKNMFDISNSKFLSNTYKSKIHNFTGLILGSEFLSLFNYTVFDYDNKAIEFYSDTIPITVLNHNSSNIVKSIIYINILISLINIIILLLFRNRK